MKLSTALLYFARTATLLILVFVLFFVVGHAFGTEESGNLDLTSAKDKWTFAFFPVLFVVGLVISLKRSLVGGVLSLIGILALFAMRHDLLDALWFYIFLLPSILYILSWWLTKRAN